MKIMQKMKCFIFSKINSGKSPDTLNMILESKNMIYDVFQLFSDGNVPLGGPDG